jgi:plastocyanin
VRPLRSRWLGCLLLALSAPAALAGAVSVSIKSTTGAAAQDAVVVFDPLDATPPPAHPTATIDQIHKTFVPRVTVLRTGTAVSFPNSDQIHHQVYSFSPPKNFQIDLYARAPQSAVVFDKPGLVVLGCNIHDQMLAFVIVVDTPYFAKTTAAGTAELDLPPGRYSLRLWHPGLTQAVPPRQILVTAAPLMLPVSLDLSGSGDNVADWP